MRQRKKHKLLEQYHFSNRVEKRFLGFNDNVRNMIISRIRKQGALAKFIKKRNTFKSIWEVSTLGILSPIEGYPLVPDTIIVVYDRNSHELVTAFNKDTPRHLTFGEWWKEFCDSFLEQSGKPLFKDMNPEDYRDAYDDGMSPYDRAVQELGDLSR
jgi:hypothetical protein